MNFLGFMLRKGRKFNVFDQSVQQIMPDRNKLEHQQMRRKAPSAKTRSEQQVSHALQILQEIRARKQRDAERESRKQRK